MVIDIITYILHLHTLTKLKSAYNDTGLQYFGW